VHSFYRFCVSLVVCGLLAACTAQKPTAPVTCEEELLTTLQVSNLIAAPTSSLMPGSIVYPDHTLTGIEGLVIDSRPLSRGDHPVARYWRHPTSCNIEGGIYPWAPPLSLGLPPNATKIGVDGFGTWRIRGLLVTGGNSGSDADALAWDQAFGALGARATHLHRPSLAALKSMVVDELCQGVNELESIVLVTAGRASPTGGGSLILDEAAVSYETLGTWLSEECSGAASVIWVLDSSYTGTFTENYESTIPTMIWRASTPGTPDAPRVLPEGGGLLTQALTEAVIERAEAQCLGAFPSVSNPGSLKSIHPSTTELWDVFRPSELRARMKSVRWQAVGLPAIAAHVGSIDSLLYQGFLRDIFADIPSTLNLEKSSVSAPAQCNSTDICELLHEGCDPGPCRSWTCVEGTCRLSESLLTPCDDGNPCTLEDTCRSGAICQGTVDSCSDGKPCTLDACLHGEGCVHVPIPDGDACDDEDPCTDNDRCNADEICAGNPAACDDGDPCTGSACDPLLGCTFANTKGPCDDSLACTHQDYCKDGSCLGIPLPCNDANTCTIDSCDEEAESCVYVHAPQGTNCSDGDLCTDSDVCADGVCSGEAKNCDDDVPCTTDTCSEGSCLAIPEPSTCLAANGCVPVGGTAPDNPCEVCSATNLWSPLDGTPCEEDGIACTQDICVAGECLHPNDPDTCVNEQGECVGVGESLGGCLFCVSTGVAAVGDLGSLCDDGDPCTAGDACSGNGLCFGSPLACCPLAAPLNCDATVLGDTEFTANLQNNWSCMDGFNFKGHEGVHSFVAPCDGPVSVNLEAPPGVGVLLVEGNADSCSAGDCSTFSQSAATLQLEEGQEILVVVDSFGANGIYELMVQCDCGD
jgi:hypothetical protein